MNDHIAQPTDYEKVPAVFARALGDTARQDIERVSAMLRRLDPQLVAGDATTLPQREVVEIAHARWPLIVTLGVSTLFWAGIALTVWA